MFPPSGFFPGLVSAIAVKKLGFYFSKEGSIQLRLKKSGLNQTFYLAHRSEMDQFNFISILWKIECWEMSPEIMLKTRGCRCFLKTSLHTPDTVLCKLSGAWALLTLTLFSSSVATFTPLIPATFAVTHWILFHL